MELVKLSPVAPPLRSKGLTGSLTGGRRKLTKYDVAEIRRLARTEGFGLGQAAQIALIRETCPGYANVSDSTLHDVLSNSSWHDPSYDRSVPLAGAPPLATLATPLHLWIIALLVVLTCSTFRSSSKDRSRS